MKKWDDRIRSLAADLWGFAQAHGLSSADIEVDWAGEIRIRIKVTAGDPFGLLTIDRYDVPEDSEYGRWTSIFDGPADWLRLPPEPIDVRAALELDRS